MFETLKNVAESVSSKAVEVAKNFADKVVTIGLNKSADHAVETGRACIDFDNKLQDLKTNSRTLSYRASDIETRIKNEEQQGRKKRKREVEKWLQLVQENQTGILALESGIQRGEIVKRIRSVEKLNAKVEMLVEQSRHFDGLVFDACNETSGEPLVTSELFGESVEKIFGRIWECLVVEKVPIIGIYGISGVGKTNLAKHIHNQILLERTEDCVYWVKVSRESSIKSLQDDIAIAIGLTLTDKKDEDKRAVELNRALMQKKGVVVLILDDVREDVDLESAGVPLVRASGFCRVIITSRSSRVCNIIGCQEKFELTALEEDEAWKLFEERFGREAISALAPQVQEIAKCVVRYHGGSPRGIMELARKMRGVMEIREWRNKLAEMEELLTREGDEMESENFR
ncbi:hypothetical protein ABFS82_04G146200 [Erythranthe guttata]|uniref:NB-ARC domain-containing protein n=1 Tax=Erythranthe guttata TaxID=4155 RepID=A0A022Q8P1_ERYGU|nr:PREDICTED: probable disease resistance protein At1g52660 [Erythranthe guttata]EYU23593.1 hypothetical protein MIMGU_mgv1a007638mg [Erythranthe guttata]|eukprot:XP_012853956.1 PREDICTED: probable disease resistance protein At1g52660 [Erythranthe guttata]